MFLILSKILPRLVYPLSLVCLLLLTVLLLRSPSPWPKRLIALALALIFLSSNSWLAASLARSLEWQHLPPAEMPTADVILVLGGGVQPALYPRQIPELTSAGDRLLYATWLYKQGKAPHILVTGGQPIIGYQGGEPSAADTAVLLQLMGVPETAVWQQPYSQNTYQDALYSRDILAEKGVERILLVTSALHMPRSVAIFRKQGIDVIPAPTDFLISQAEWEYALNGGPVQWLSNFLPSEDALEVTTDCLKEYIGLLVYRLRGWL